MKLEFLKSLPVFDGLAEEELTVLANDFDSKQYHKGDKIFETGDHSEALYLIEHGFIRLQMEGHHALATLGPGSLLGEETLFRGANHEITAEAAADLTLLELLDRKLREIFLQNPDIGIKLSRNFGSLLVQMDDYLVERLSKINEFGTLPKHTLQAVARHLQPRIVRAQTPIHRGGEMPSALFIVEHGVFELRPDPHVPGQETQNYEEGSIIGAMALLTNKPYNETAIAVEDSLLWVLSEESFQSINSANPGLRRSLGRNVRSKLGKSDQAQAVLRLSQMPLFADIPPQSLQAISQRMVLQHFPAGERVYLVGEAGDAVYFLENGEVELTEENANGVVVEKARVGAGGFFGEMSLLTGVIRTEDATATRNTNLWILYKRDLDELTAQHPAIGKALSQGLATRLSEPEPAEDDLARFREFDILAELNGSDLRQVTRYLRPMRYRAGETVYQVDMPADALYFLESGQAYVQSFDGNSWMIGPGDTFGERAILSGEPHSSTVIADSDLDVWMLEKSEFDVVATRYPSVALNITRMFSRRMSNQYAMVSAPQSAQSYDQQGEQARQQIVPRMQPIQRHAQNVNRGSGTTNNGFLDWFGNLSTFGKVRLALFVLLLLWLLGVAAPWMLLNLFSGTSLASGAALSPAASARALGAVASMGSFDVVAQDDELAKALIVADSLAAPTPTHTPPPTATPAEALLAEKAAPVAAAVQRGPTQTPVPLIQLAAAQLQQQPQAQVAAAQPQAAPAAQQEEAPAEIQAAAAQPARAWDPRLDQLSVNVTEAAVGSGQPYWRLIDARWANEAEAGGKHHIYVEVLDENGNRITGQPVTVSWPEGVVTGVTEDKRPPDYAYNFQMYSAGPAYSVKVDGLPSDQLHGAGLGSIDQRAWGIHVSYYLTYQRATKP